MDNRSGARHRFLPIDGWPGKYQLMVAVPHALVGVDNDNTIQLVPGTSAFSTWVQAPAHLLRDYSTYVFSGTQIYQDQINFYTVWNPAVAAADRFTDVNPLYDTINYTWPPVLLDLLIVKDGANVADRPRYIEGINDRSTVKISTYFSNTAWSEYECRTDLPHPSTIKGDFYGTNVIFPECLHEDVFMKSRTNDSAEIFDCIPSEASNRQGSTIHFPATNHTEWIDHVIDVKTADLGGLHRRTVTTVLAPPMPEITYA